MGRVEYNWDIAKARRNFKKHGVLFADARHMTYESLTAFFEQWKPKN